MSKKKSQQEKGETHEDLKGFDIKINEFGEIVSNIPVEELNEFLDKNVKDKKLMDRGNLSQSVDNQEEE